MSEQQASTYRQQGFLHFRSLFDREEIEAVRRDAIRVFDYQLEARGTRPQASHAERDWEASVFDFFRDDVARFANCGKQIQHLVSLHRLSLDPRILDLLGGLGLTFPNICTRPVLFFNSRRLATKEVYWRVFAHQDWRSMQGSLNSIVVWIPLHDIDRRLGALEVVPESHRLGLVATEVVERFGKVDGFSDADFESIEAEQGDVLVFSSFLVHRSGTNSTDSIRWSCHFRYNDLAESSFIERGYPHAYVYHPVDELLTPGFPSAAEVRRLFEDPIACPGSEAA
jgi:phytanoyl-CoA hydroxylase